MVEIVAGLPRPSPRARTLFNIVLSWYLIPSDDDRLCIPVQEQDVALWIRVTEQPIENEDKLTWIRLPACPPPRGASPPPLFFGSSLFPEPYHSSNAKLVQGSFSLEIYV